MPIFVKLCLKIEFMCHRSENASFSLLQQGPFPSNPSKDTAHVHPPPRSASPPFTYFWKTNHHLKRILLHPPELYLNPPGGSFPVVRTTLMFWGSFLFILDGLYWKPVKAKDGDFGVAFVDTVTRLTRLRQGGVRQTCGSGQAPSGSDALAPPISVTWRPAGPGFQ